ncbi:hypothetical protein [Pedobacter miscanthi]|uniref:Uncharacterized protein n=1 Tax=Pedobacter miscanthi TaxID=2259170 RepID=A0A366LDA5_9SPHI|nr:hypothetical protein [Pedobacter miscanthi]RBQ11469.1 hypothetical protein DRW42_03120 [Pedobacter miscanthi]
MEKQPNRPKSKDPSSKRSRDFLFSQIAVIACLFENCASHIQHSPAIDTSSAQEDIGKKMHLGAEMIGRKCLKMNHAPKRKKQPIERINVANSKQQNSKLHD